MQTRSHRWTRRLALMAALIALSGAQATERYIAQAGQTPDPGAGYTSWSGAASNLQEVLDLAATVNGDILYITNGTYKLSDEVVVGKRVTIRSYNAQGETDPDHTILDADNYAGKPVTNRVMRITNRAMIDGLTLTGGQRTGGDTFADMGGGVLITTTGATAVLTNCVISGNYAQHGGGVGIYYASGSVTHSRIVDNEAVTWGGGAYLYSYGHLIAEVRDSVIGWNKSSGEGSGVAIYNGKAPNVYNCDIVSNANHSAVGFISLGMVSNCVIRGTTNALNGAVAPRSSAVNNQVWDCQIVDNYGAGGVVDRGITYRNCLIARNLGYHHGGLRATVTGGGTVDSCTIAGNSADRPVVGGGGVGGIWMSVTNVVFRNTILSGNTGTLWDDIWFAGGVALADGSNCFHNSCCPTVALTETQGNVHADPRFEDAATGNFRLRGSSPCVNTGDNQDWMSNWLDLDGNPRLDSLSGVVDMGCFEHIRVGALLLVR